MGKEWGFILLIAVAVSTSAVAEQSNCNYPGDPTAGLAVQDGYMQWIAPSVLAPFKAVLPQVADPQTQAILQSPNTMWYDEGSMVFGYQDSVGDPVGFRAQCVGRATGDANLGGPIGDLDNLFGADFRFVFPFRKAAGTDNVAVSKVLNFWAPPKQDGKVLPVKIWRTVDRGHYYWTFPDNTVIGEVLFEQAPNGNWYPFEIRTRTRYSGGWAVNLFRPFTTAASLAAAIETQPDWQASIDLGNVVNFLNDNSTLVANHWESKVFAGEFTPIDGALDKIPEITETDLVIKLLTQTPFVSAQGAIWKENATLTSYGPASDSAFNIVPGGYEAGMLPVNEDSCMRCHEQASRAFGDIDFNTVLYGEVWGEDRIFTWHPFKTDQYIYGVWDETQGSRQLNPKLLQANLIVNEQPSPSDANYHPLSSVFVPPNVGQARGKESFVQRFKESSFLY